MVDDKLCEEEIALLAQNIEKFGYGVISKFVTVAELDQLRSFVRRTVAAAGNRYVALNGNAPVAHTVLGRMTESKALKRICMRTYELATSRPAPDEDYHQVLRCLTGDTGRRESMIFHFDSHVLAVLLPIEIPNGMGELILLPNVRPIRQWYVTNLLDKVALDNSLRQWLLRQMARRHSERFVRIALTPGDLYFFTGYRSVHANAACDADQIRATALFHYGNLHHASRLRRLLRRSRYESNQVSLNPTHRDRGPGRP